MKIKISIKSGFRYLYIALLIANIIAVVYLFNFTNKYLYNTITLDRHLLENSISKTEDIDIKEVEEIIAKHEEKTKSRVIRYTNNPFD